MSVLATTVSFAFDWASSLGFDALHAAASVIVVSAIAETAILFVILKVSLPFFAFELFFTIQTLRRIHSEKWIITSVLNRH